MIFDLSNYATKPGLKGATNVDTSNLSGKGDLSSLKARLHKLNVDQLKTVPPDLTQLSNVVESDIVKKLYMTNWLEI